MMEAIPVTSEMLDEYLPLIGWHLDQFAANGQYTPKNFEDQIRDRERQLWVAWDNGVKAVVLTAIADDRLGSCLVTHAAGKGMADWLHLFPVIVEWAKAQGCKRIEATARPGWERMLKGFDMKKSHVILEARL